jgi:2-oxoglutarate ferredoxin oxidoreductase subunit alpha
MEQAMPKTNDMSFRIAGAAGQGVESSGAGFAQALAQGGLHVFALQDYMSRIRGGLNFFQVRAHENPLYCHDDGVQILLPLNEEALDAFYDDVVPGGGVIYDQDLKVDAEAIAGGDRGLRRKAMPVPLVEMAKEHGDRVMANTAALGAAAGVTGYSYERIAGVIRQNFRRKGGEVVVGGHHLPPLAPPTSMPRSTTLPALTGSWMPCLMLLSASSSAATRPLLWAPWPAAVALSRPIP